MRFALALMFAMALSCIADAETPAHCWDRKRAELRAGRLVVLDCAPDPLDQLWWAQSVKNSSTPINP